jgi:hypothetical protein
MNPDEADPETTGGTPPEGIIVGEMKVAYTYHEPITTMISAVA